MDLHRLCKQNNIKGLVDALRGGADFASRDAAGLTCFAHLKIALPMTPNLPTPPPPLLALFNALPSPDDTFTNTTDKFPVHAAIVRPYAPSLSLALDNTKTSIFLEWCYLTCSPTLLNLAPYHALATIASLLARSEVNAMWPYLSDVLLTFCLDLPDLTFDALSLFTASLLPEKHPELFRHLVRLFFATFNATAASIFIMDFDRDFICSCLSTFL